MTPRNEPDCSQDIAKLTAIEPEAVATLTKLVTELLDADDHTRTEVLKSLVCVSEADRLLAGLFPEGKKLQRKQFFPFP